jgi:hypothetical protein
MRRVWLRAAALALAAVGAIVALTLFVSSEKIPPCLVTAPAWRPPADNETHRYQVVFPERAACFFAIGEEPRLVGEVRLENARAISAAAPLGDDIALRTDTGVLTFDPRASRVRRGGVAPFASDTLVVRDDARGVVYVTQPGFLGFRVIDDRTGVERHRVRFEGFTWNPDFGPNPPSHGLSLAPDRPELWVLDAPNSTVHVFDVSGALGEVPRQIEDIRLSKPLSGDRSPCSRDCERIGSLQHSADGRYVYVGDSGDVIDTRTREEVANLEALHNSRVHLEVHFVDGRVVFPRRSR